MKAPTGFDVSLLRRPARVEAVLTCVRGGVVLADGVRVADLVLESSADRDVVDRVTFSLPDAFAPVDEWSPFAPMGQVVHVAVEVAVDGLSVFSVDRGWFVLDEVREEGEKVSVVALGLLDRLVRDPFPLPSSPSSGATLRMELERLCAPHLSVVMDCDDRPLPGGLSWGRERMKSIRSLLDAFGLGVRVGEDLCVHVFELWDRPADVAYSRGNLVLRRVRRWDHHEANKWTAVSSGSAGGGLSATVVSDRGPFDPALYGVVSEVVEVSAGSSEALWAAAGRKLGESYCPTGVRTFFLVPDHRLEVGDSVSVDAGGGEPPVVGHVVGLSLPCGFGASEMRVDLRVRLA